MVTLYFPKPNKNVDAMTAAQLEMASLLVSKQVQVDQPQGSCQLWRHRPRSSQRLHEEGSKSANPENVLPSSEQTFFSGDTQGQMEDLCFLLQRPSISVEDAQARYVDHRKR